MQKGIFGGKDMKRSAFLSAMLAFAVAAVPAAGVLAAPVAVWAPVDWSAVEEEIGAASRKNIDVAVGDDMEIPAGTLRRLAGKNVTLALHTGDGIAVSVSGKDLKATDLNLKITITGKEGYEIPDSASRDILAGALYGRMVNIAEKEAYAVRLNMHFDLGREYAGKYANLYHFDEAAGKMVCEGSFVVTDGGMAMFPLSRGDEYILTVTENLPSGGRIGYTVMAGDCLSRIAARYDISLKSLLDANPGVGDGNMIYPGQVLTVVKP